MTALLTIDQLYLDVITLKKECRNALNNFNHQKLNPKEQFKNNGLLAEFREAHPQVTRLCNILDADFIGWCLHNSKSAQALIKKYQESPELSDSLNDFLNQEWQSLRDDFSTTYLVMKNTTEKKLFKSRIQAEKQLQKIEGSKLYRIHPLVIESSYLEDENLDTLTVTCLVNDAVLDVSYQALREDGDITIFNRSARCPSDNYIVYFSMNVKKIMTDNIQDHKASLCEMTS